MSALLSVQGLQKRFGGLVATDDVSLEVQPGECHALIGPNGAGKTTLMGLLVGELTPDAGAIHFQGKDISTVPAHQRSLRGIARSYQITQLLKGFSVLENVMMMILARTGSAWQIWKPVRRNQAVSDEAIAALQQVGLAHRAHDDVMALAHGEHRQLELAMALAMKPTLLLLDEPLAGMSRSESQQMITLLQALKTQYSILMVEHDMEAVFQLADRISVLVYGRIIACDTPQAIRQNEAVSRAYLGDEE
ncbi:MAG: ABC transporter ATP-binding protein [Paenalcaligenes sp.]